MEMNLPIDAKVLCADGLGGRSTRVIVNPVTRKVTHLVVRERDLRRTERLVPIGHIRATVDGAIYLDCTRQELAKMERPPETELVWADIPGLDEPHPYLLSPDIACKLSMVRRGSLPEGELCIRRGARVQATDGKAGSIDEIAITPGNGEITHLLLRAGYPWGWKEVAVPVSEIDRLEERTVHLKLDRKGVEALPSVQVRRKWL